MGILNRLRGKAGKSNFEAALADKVGADRAAEIAPEFASLQMELPGVFSSDLGPMIEAHPKMAAELVAEVSASLGSSASVDEITVAFVPRFLERVTGTEES